MANLSHKSLFLILVPALFLFTHSGAQDVDFNHITTDNGLLTGNVRAILEDYQGFFWFGTENGLQRYDGYSMVSYQHDQNDSTSLSSNYILCLFEDSRKNLWIGTLDGGLCLYDRITDSFRRFRNDPSDKNSILGNYVRVIYESSDSILYVGLEEGGFSHFRTPSAVPTSITFTNIEIPRQENSAATRWVSTLIEDTDQTMLIGVNGSGLTRFDPATGSFNQVLKDSCSNKVQRLFLDSKNRLWIGTWDNGLYVYDRNSHRLVHHISDVHEGFLHHDQIESIFEDGEGNYWIGTDNGLSVLPNNADLFSRAPFTTYVHSPFESKSLLSNSIKAFFIDTRNRMWIGSYFGGINIYDKNALKFHPIKSKAWVSGTLSHNNVFAFEEGRNGNLWVGTDGGGLHLLKGSINDVGGPNFTKIPLKVNGMPADKIKCLAEDRQGNLWIGTWGTGMFRLNIKTNEYEHFGHDLDSEKSISADEVIIIRPDSLDNLWIGTFNGGLNYYDRKHNTFTYYRDFVASGKPGQINRITSICIAGNGKVWVGREVGGLNLFDPEAQTFTTIVQGKLSRQLTILSIHEDKDGILWLGSNSIGLLRYDPRQNMVRVYDEASGMANNVVYAILEDPTSGNLWMSTNKGLSVLDPSREAFEHYTKADGLQGDQFNHGSAMLHSSGIMLFGGTDGMNALNPGMIKKETHFSPLVFTRFWINNTSMNVRDAGSPLSENIILTPAIDLNHTQNSFSIEFAMLDYNLNHRNQYRYLLEGLNTTWQDIGQERKAIFTNLDPGDYVLRVKASNSDGLWTENEKSIVINIHPAWWQTWLFKGALLVGAILFVFVMVRIRINYLINQRAKLELQVSQRTAELNFKNEELNENVKELHAQKIEIAEKNQEIQAQNEELTSQNDQIITQRENLEEARNKLKEINDQLEILVDQRTKKLNVTISELDKTVAELDRFVYSASHDLSAPLKSVLGLVRIAKGEKDPDELQKYYEYIETSIQKLDRVIKSLVEFSRNSHQDISISKFNIHDLAQDVLHELAFWPDAQKITLLNKIETNQNIYSDRDRVKVILHNLIGNGIKYADFSKPEPFIQLETHSSNEGLSLIVSDNGIGIESEKQNKIFDMYYRGTDRSKGSGLGLFIVKEIVLKIGGRIEVSSSRGRGTTFKLTFKNEDSLAGHNRLPVEIETYPL